MLSTGGTVTDRAALEALPVGAILRLPDGQPARVQTHEWNEQEQTGWTPEPGEDLRYLEFGGVEYHQPYPVPQWWISANPLVVIWLPPTA